MIDMGVNKVVFGAVAIMDISDSTVTEDTLGKGVTAYRADGEKIIGTADIIPPPKNMLASAIDTAGNIYNGKGWKDQTRLSSSGGDSSANGRSTTGYIPCKQGDVIRLQGINHKPSGDSTYRIVFYTSSFAMTGSGVIQGGYTTAYQDIGAVTNSSGYLTQFTVANYDGQSVANAAYFRICGDTFASDASITISSESGGSGGGSVETGTFTVVDNGMYEPGANEYYLTSDQLQISKRTRIIIYSKEGGVSTSNVVGIFVKNNYTFEYRPGYRNVFDSNTNIKGDNIVAYGYVPSGMELYWEAL